MAFEIDFLPVGESFGDAIVIRYGDNVSGYRLHVVDGGRLATATTIIEHIENYYPGYHIDHMVLSHADNDHACGLIGVIKRFRVMHLWMNRPWLYADEILDDFHGNFNRQGLIENIKDRHPYLVELEELALAQGTHIHEVFQGDQIGAFTVLAPDRNRYVSSIHEFEKTPVSYKTEEAASSSGLFKFLMDKVQNFLEESWDIETLAANVTTSASNESCVVQYAVLDNKGILLTADVGPIGLSEAAAIAEARSYAIPKLIQVPHHGSRHNVTPAVLDWWLGSKKTPGTHAGYAFCSIGSNMPDYPRGQVINAFTRRGYPVYSTRDKFISYSDGGGHPGLTAIVPEDFVHTVKAL